MRALALMMMAALAACAASGGDMAAETAPSPFPVERGTAPPPPLQGVHPAPPQGLAPGGFDFGQWRGADPAVYGPAFQARVRARAANKSAGELRADLEANGFRCEDGPRMDCRIEIFERQCAHDWYVVLERGAEEPIAGYDVMCLGAR